MMAMGPVKSQSDQYAFGNAEMNVLYRGYKNKLKIVPGENCTNCKIIPINMTISENEYGFIAKPGRDKLAQLIFLDSISMDTAKVMSFKVLNLPNPQILWGGKRSGDKANINSKLVQCKYGPSVPLMIDFKVIHIALAADDIEQGIETPGEYLTEEMLKAIRNVPKDKTICLICDVKGPDGIVRKMSGCYKR
jgi:hypothetical protein